MSRLTFTLVLYFAISSTVQGQDWRIKIGYFDLMSEKGGLMGSGGTLETGAGLRVAQIEAPQAQLDVNGDPIPYNPNTAIYLPDRADPLLPLNTTQFSGKTFTNGSSGPNNGVSTHAQNVGIAFYGNSSSMTPGITDITGYDVNDYFNRILFNSGGDPMAQGFDVSNHSYIVPPGGTNPLTPADKIELLQRFDFVINRDNMVAVVGTNNGGSTPTPDLWAPSFNAISVGISSGGHSHTLTTNYPAQAGGNGRFKPDIVAPTGSTSGATAIVSTAAALLTAAAGTTNARQNEVIKSTLYAGAIKESSWAWSRTSTQPIDSIYGFGEVNILNSYHIYEGGEFEGAASDTFDPVTTSVIENMGWDYGFFDAAAADFLSYDFSILPGTTASELSAALVWNLNLTDTNPNPGVFNPSTSDELTPNVFDPTGFLSNLDLKLFDLSSPLVPIDSSVSTDYNLEHIFLNNLGPGNYRFQISGDSVPTDFGFSWRISTVPEPSSIYLLSWIAFGVVARRRRTA